MSSDNHNKEYINSKGEPVLRISQVIKTLGKDQIAVWANMLGWKRIDYKAELERTANIGTFAHAMIENYYSDNMLCVYDFEDYGVYRFSDQQEAYNAAESFFKWLHKNERQYKVKFTEKVLVGNSVGGTIDCIIESPFDASKVILVDYKTSSRIQFSQFLQLAGYVYLYEEIYGPDTVDGVMILRLDKRDGNKAESKFIHRDKLGPYIECFQSLITVAYLTKALESNFRYDYENYEKLF